MNTPYSGRPVRGEASVNGSAFSPAELRIAENADYIRSERAVKPDPAWEHTDSAGHFHAFAADGSLPTCEAYTAGVACDGSCGGICGGEGYLDRHWKCAVCGEEIEPRYVPDTDARAGLPVVTSRSASLLVIGTGPLPPLGQVDHGDGTMTLTMSPAPVRVSLRMRADGQEMVGTGLFCGDLDLGSARGVPGWRLTVEAARLEPRLSTGRKIAVPRA